MEIDKSRLRRASPTQISWDRRSACWCAYPYDLWQLGDAVGIYAPWLLSRAELMLCSSWSSGKSPSVYEGHAGVSNGFSLQARRASFQTIQVREPDVLI